MKKTLLFMMALLIGSLSAHADFVSKKEAEAKAQNFISQRMMRSDNGSQANSKAVAMKKQLVCVSKEESNPAYYIFNYADSTGFVIVSAESNTLEILAYSDQGYFHEEDIDKGAEVFLAQYERDAAIARANALTAKQKEYVRNATTDAASTEVILETACFNQEDGYWNEKYSPLLGAPAGCTATAAAIIMHYHQWPAQGKGSNSYVSDTHNLSLSRDFSQDTYNWSCIPKTPYYKGGWSEEAKNEVPKILLACGIACDMDYDYGGSGASTNAMVKSMVNNFSYGIGYKYYSYYNKPDADMTEAWQAARNSIDNNMPVFVAAMGTRGGHAFVLDGYNDKYYHYNMGWGGSNGWWSNGSISYDNYNVYEFYTDLCPQSGKVVISGTTPDGISYSLNDGGVLRISGNGEIGESLNERIKDYLIAECIIEEGVTAIRNYSLSNFNISKLTIPSTVREIDDVALPSGIHDVTVAEGNARFTSPGNYCLYDKVKKRLMNYSDQESEIRFPEGVEILGSSLFKYNSNITEIEIPEGVKSIDDRAFLLANNLQKVTLPSTLNLMGDYVFAYTSLKTLTCKSIYPPSGTYELFYNTNVDTEGTLYVPYAGLEKYAEDPEWNIFNVIDVIPGSENWDNHYMANVEVTTAGTLKASMGSDAADIRELNVSGTINGTDLKFIRELCSSANDNRALSILDLSKARIVAGGEAYYIDSYNYDYILSENDIIPDYAFAGCKLDKLIIPETTKEIGRMVLPKNLKTIELPEGLKIIDDYAFWNDMTLCSLHIPASVEKIGECMSAASWNLTELDVAKDNKYYKSEGNIIYTIDGKTIVAAAILYDETVNIPEGVEKINENTFFGSKFKKVCLPSTLKDISYSALSYIPLTEVTCLATVPPEARNAFRISDIPNCTLYVPSASVSSYKTANMWSEFYQIKDLSTSAIDDTLQSPLPDKKHVIYDLSGRRISNTKLLRPGIYIINGRKVRK